MLRPSSVSFRAIPAISALFGALALLLCAPGISSAQEQTELRDGDLPPAFRKKPEKDRRLIMIELKFGPYKPGVDGEFGGSAKPYQKVFGSGQHLMTQLELDVELFHFRRLGTMGVGVGWGYSKISANAFALDGVTRAADQTTFTIMPITALAVWRYDVLAHYNKIPIVPYAKIGVDYWLYSITDGNGNTARCNDPLAKCTQGGYGKGATYGFHFSAGAAFLLDVIDPDTANTAKSEIGLAHTYVFAELLLADIADFHKSGALRLSTTTVLGGLAFEF